MKITFYGVRGSLATPGPTTIKYGGNTSCVLVELNSGQQLILDSGTGIRHITKKRCTVNDTIFLLLTHTHWDHINGFPFFEPIHTEGHLINICAGAEEASYPLNPPRILSQMDGTVFPLTVNRLECDLNVISKNHIPQFLKKNTIQVDSKALNHPGGGLAYLIREDGLSVAYVTDNELNPPYEMTTDYAEWVDFLSNIDVLIHDSQYEQTDMPYKHGWGHSLISEVRQLAIDAEVKTLSLFHHDPSRTDAQLDDIQRENEKIFKNTVCPTQSVTAIEGMSIELSKSKTNSGEHFVKISTQKLI